MIATRNLLPLYRLGTRGFGLIARPFLYWRMTRGKEDGERLAEKTGLPSLARPPGRLAWLHGASVGESISLLPLVEQLAARGLSVLVTTGTLSSARILAGRLGPGAMHQFAPLDVPRFIARFLAHWQPDLVLVAESEIWPNLFCDVAQAGIPLVLVSARLSARSCARWQRFHASIAAILQRVDLCLAQTQEDGSRLLRLGARRVQVTGNLKYDVPALPADTSEVASLAAAIGSRPVWLAASTHTGEEALAGEVHLALKTRFPNLLTIIAPRHPQRTPQIAAGLEAAGLRIGLRSQRAAISDDLDIYLADTMGEMGLLYRLANVVFVGKSLETGQPHGSGGQNPIEPAKLGNAILHGPRVENFTEVYAALDGAGAGHCVGDAAELADALETLLADRAHLRAMARAAQDCVSGFGGATARIMQALEPCLMQMNVEDDRSGATTPAASATRA